MSEFEEKDTSKMMDFVPINLMGDLLTRYLNRKLIFTFEELSHDGYDREGPQSNLFDLYVIYNESNKYYMDVWHREDWFVEIEVEPYQLCERFVVNKQFVDDTLKKDKVEHDFRTSEHIQLIQSMN